MSEQNIKDFSHVAYSDESYSSEGQYRSVSLISFEKINLEEFESELKSLLDESGMQKEFKWNRLGSAKYRFVAEKFIEWSFRKASEKKLRVDILIWDTADSRHVVMGRDDSENLKRMYFHLIKNVLFRRWPDKIKWSIRPDQNHDIGWDVMKAHLDNHSLGFETDLIDGKTKIVERFDISNITEVGSHESPKCQLADLYAGLAAFSYQKCLEYKQWLAKVSPQGQLFETPELEMSAKDEERFKLLQSVERLKAKYSGISFSNENGFRTWDPKLPINFWFYKPQRDSDKAPTKNKM